MHSVPETEPLVCFGISDDKEPICVNKQGAVGIALGGLLLAWFLWNWAATVRFNRKYKLPPRVPALPIIGNTLQLPSQHQGPVASKLAEKYGEMFTMNIGGRDWVFLNSSRVVNDLLERRSAIYCSRPPFPMVQEIMSRNSRIVLMGHSQRWRSLRKTMHQILSARQLNAFRPFQDLESKHLLYEYLHKPDKWYLANSRYSNSVIMSIVFGIRSDMDNPRLAALNTSMEKFIKNIQPGVNIVDVFPALAKLPTFLQWWRRRGNQIYEETRSVYALELQMLKERKAAGKQRPCFATDLLEKSKELEAWGETQTLYVFGTLMEAGTDTTRVSIAQAVAAMAAYPDWVDRARKELDEICGHSAQRLPGFEDRQNMPYMNAVTKEIFRWRPIITEIGVPTTLTKDDEYEGYRFPAGTDFMWNAWHICLNPEEYEQPERFWPERFLNEDLEKPLKGHWSFGTGRRVCVGWQVGDSNVWLAVSRLLYCFNISQVEDDPIDTMNISQMDWDKAPFKVKIVPRSDRHADLVERLGSEAANTMY